MQNMSKYICLFVVLSICNASRNVPSWVEDEFPRMSSEDMSMTWIWGPVDTPRVARRNVRFFDRFPHHGFIQLQVQGRVVASIEKVKRPPIPYWPSEEPFSSRVLPVAIARILTVNDLQFSDIDIMTVEIDAEPYEAACKCYLKSFLLFGFILLDDYYIYTRISIPASQLRECLKKRDYI